MASPWDEFSPAQSASPWSEFQPVTAPKAPAPQAQRPLGSRLSAKLGEGLVPGFSRLTAAVQAGIDPLVPGRTAQWGEDYGARYAEHLRANQGESAETQREHPYLSAAVQAAGAIPSAVAMGAPAPGLLGSLKAGAGAGAMYGAGDTRSRTAGGVLSDAMFGAGVGAGAAVLPQALRAAENAARAGVRAVTPRLKPSPAARQLLNKGVPLTVGQIAPNSTLGHIEEVASQNPLGMEAERQAAKDAYRNIVLGKTVAPGAKPPTKGTTVERQAEILKGFDPVYAQFKDIPIDPKVLQSVPQAATKMPGKGVDARTSAGVKAEIENALTVLGIKPAATPHAHGHGGAAPAAPKGLVDQFGAPIPDAPKPLPKATAGDLLKVRENIRQQMSDARRSDKFDRLRLLGHAEDVITGALEQNLSKADAATLRAADRQYAKLMTVLDSAPGGHVEFTPEQLARSVERSAGRRGFKTGKAGDLYDLAQAGQEVFAQRVPRTGIGPVVLAGLPKSVAGPLSRVANAGRSTLLQGGPTALPQPVPAKPQANAVSGPGARALVEALRGRLQPGAAVPAAAEDRNRRRTRPK
jgi:hypothetical protein